jgi:hypothetical protein
MVCLEDYDVLCFLTGAEMIGLAYEEASTSVLQ